MHALGRNAIAVLARQCRHWHYTWPFIPNPTNSTPGGRRPTPLDCLTHELYRTVITTPCLRHGSHLCPGRWLTYDARGYASQGFSYGLSAAPLLPARRAVPPIAPLFPRRTRLTIVTLKAMTDRTDRRITTECPNLTPSISNVTTLPISYLSNPNCRACRRPDTRPTSDNLSVRNPLLNQPHRSLPK